MKNKNNINVEVSENKSIKLSPTAKKGIIYAVVAVIVVAIITVSGLLISATGTDMIQNKIGSKIVLALMPSTIEGVTSDGKMTFYVKENPKYDAGDENSQPLDAFIFYYKNSKGKDVETNGAGAYIDSDGVSHNVMLGFFEKALEKLQVVKKVIKVSLSLFFAFAIVFSIYLWYKAWAKREDEIKKELYGKKK